MPLNLINDAWIPVRRHGKPDIVRPDQIAETGIESFDWPRPDLNLACMELLIGLLYLADAPDPYEDRMARHPDPARLRERLAPFASAFELTGEGPRFMQDFSPLSGDPSPPDMLFIDSAGSQTIRNNADLMVHRSRYPALSLPLAAISLYALQDFAPSGGKGNRTSMRGGGPLVTLARPPLEGDTPLWSLLWANVPTCPQEQRYQPDKMAECLPWMHPTRTSENNEVLIPPHGNILHPEVFFGMPRRLRLVFAEGRCAVTGEEGVVVTGVIQRPYGNNYSGWVHPLSPYYYDKDFQKLPMHPKPGAFTYPNWRGVAFGTKKVVKAESVAAYQADSGEPARVLAAGWAMDNMKPLDFIWSETPLFPLSPQAEEDAEEFVLAAEAAARALTACLKEALNEPDDKKGTIARTRESFFERSQAGFETVLKALSRLDGAAGLDSSESRRAARREIAETWLKELRKHALRLFGVLTHDLLLNSDMDKTEIVVEARKKLILAFTGHPPLGTKIFTPLDLPLPARRRKKQEEPAT